MSRVNDPFDMLAEEFVLGSVLHKPVWYFDVPATAEHFWNEAARSTWIAIDQVMSSATSVPDRGELVSLVRNRLRTIGGDSAIAAAHGLGTDEYLVSLIQRVVSRGDLDAHWPKVDKAYKQRATIDLCRRYALAASSQSPDVNLDVLAQKFQEEFSEVLQGRDLEFLTTRAMMERSMDRVAELRATGQESSRIPTGLKCIDEPLRGGLSLGHYTVIAAKRKMGKSRMLLSMALSMALSSRWAVDFYSIEMTDEDLGDLANAWYLDRPKDELLSLRNVTDEDFLEARNSISNLKADARWFFGPQHTLGDIQRNTLARATAEDRPLAVFVDYLQEVDVGYPAKEYDRVTDVTRSLSQMSRKLKCAVIAAAQFNRESGSGEPQVHQLRATGQIEQDVNELFIFHRAAMEDRSSTPEQRRIGHLRLALNRHGDQSYEQIYCDMATLKFRTKFEEEDHHAGF